MWKYCEICCVSITIYIKEKKSTNGRRKNKIKTVTTVATMLLGTITTVRNLKKEKKKKEVPHQISTVDEQWDTLNEQCASTVAA